MLKKEGSPMGPLYQFCGTMQLTHGVSPTFLHGLDSRSDAIHTYRDPFLQGVYASQSSPCFCSPFVGLTNLAPTAAPAIATRQGVLDGGGGRTPGLSRKPLSNPQVQWAWNYGSHIPLGYSLFSQELRSCHYACTRTEGARRGR